MSHASQKSLNNNNSALTMQDLIEADAEWREYQELQQELEQLEQKKKKLSRWIETASTSPRTLSELANSMGISAQRISHLEKRAIIKCRREFLKHYQPTT